MMIKEKALKSCTWLVILGYGRSGSTWLELKIATEAGFSPCGELCNFYIKSDCRCSCTASLGDCEVWKNRTLNSKSYYDFISSIAKDQDFVVESSKSTVKSIKHLKNILMMRSEIGVEVVPVVVFKNPIGILQSRDKGDNEKMKMGMGGNKEIQAIRFLLNWPVAYVIAFLFSVLIKKKPYVVNFDNFESVLKMIEAAKLMMANGDNLKKELHIIEGNRLAKNFEKFSEYKMMSYKKPTLYQKIIFLIVSPMYFLLRLSAKG